jgi:FkbM family methyltransferase
MRIRSSAAVRKLLWRAGRKMYTYARGEGLNDPRTNGEYWLLEQALQASTAPQVLLDIGANRGNWTAEALRLVQPEASIHIHAFEPSLATRSMLAARFVQSGAVTVQAYALADAQGEAIFYTREDGAGTNSLSPSSGPNAELTRVTTIDGFLQESGIATVSMVKIDTEGFDFLVLRGAQKTLHDGHMGVIQFEYNWRWLLNHACLRDVFELISNKPYRLGKLVGSDLELFDGWHAELDRFFETNYVLIRKDSPLCGLGSVVQFDRSSVGVSGH